MVTFGFVAAAVGLAIGWGRINRLGYTWGATSVVRTVMKVSTLSEQLIRSYVVLAGYLVVGIVGSALFLVVFQVDIAQFAGMPLEEWWIVPLAFIAENSFTGLVMQLVLLVRPQWNVTSDLNGVLWVRHTRALPRAMRPIAPLCTALTEEMYFRGTLFVILMARFGSVGTYWAVTICTLLFVLQQVLQTDTLGQAFIFVVGSTSVSVIGCLTIVYTGSIIPTLLCHAGYASLYFELGMTARSASGAGARESRSVGPARF